MSFLSTSFQTAFYTFEYSKDDHGSVYLFNYYFEILLQSKIGAFYFNIFSNVFFPWFQQPVSHEPSEIILICWFYAQETFIIIIINAENSCIA